MLQKVAEAGIPFARELCKRLFKRSLILAYHSISTPTYNIWNNAVTPEHFAQQLAVLHSHYNVVDLQTAIRNRELRENGSRTVAITFDDGYVDNLERALPILEHFEMPATFFLTTGYLDQKREFWWDELEQILMHPNLLPKQLEIVAEEETWTWELGDAAHHTAQDITESKKHFAWDASLNSRLGFCYKVWQRLAPLDHATRQIILLQIAEWAGVEPILRPKYRMMKAEEIKELALHPLITIGGHTHVHNNLAFLPASLQQHEIAHNRKILTSLIGEEPSYISYPHGDFDQQTLILTQQSGYDSAFTITPGTVWRYSTPYKLPRLASKDCNGEMWHEQIQRWF